MKQLTFLFVSLFVINTINAQKMNGIKLNAPDKSRGTSVMQALASRQSARAYADKALSIQDLSDLVWAANGINRPESGKRTAPSALNAQDIDIYVCMKEGTYFYDAAKNELTPVAPGDHRPLVAAQQDFLNNAPVFLVLVADISRFEKGDEKTKLIMSAYDAGIVSQNINLFCASNGLATVPRASMDIPKLKTILKLSPSQHPLMNNPVGYPEGQATVRKFNTIAK